MSQSPADPTALEGDDLRRWYLRSPDEIEQERQAKAAKEYDDFFGGGRQVAAGERASNSAAHSVSFRADQPARPAAAPTGPSFNVDRKFFAQMEGDRSDMYLPKDPETHQVLDDSGPTIGVGVDLGRKDVAYLKSLGIDPALVKKLSPYVGRRGVQADAFVKAHPLMLAPVERVALNTAVQNRELRKLAEKFDGASKVGPFHQLPKDTQTAIGSLYFQYGADAPEKATPDYWRQITSGDWEGAYQNLRNFGDKYKTRRGAESVRLLGDIKSGALPKPRANAPIVN